MKLNLGLIFGGRSGEHEVSLQSAQSIADAVDRTKFNLLLIAIDKKGNWFLADENNYLSHASDPKNICLHVKPDQQIAIVPIDNTNRIISLFSGEDLGKLDVLFPIIHGTFGEDGSLQGFCSIINLPCVGADVLGSSVGMDKLIAKQLLMQAGIPVARYLLVEKEDNLDQIVQETKARFIYPVFVKPVCSGSSVGVYKIHNKKELEDSIRKALRFDRRVLIEEAVDGREIECSILGNDDLIASVPGEIIPRHSFYSYEAKYLDAEGAILEMPAKISDDTVVKVQTIAKKAFKTLACSGMARVDMFLRSSGEIVLNEINTLPGFTRISMYPKLLQLSGISYPELIERLVDLAVEKHKLQDIHLQNILSETSY
ncbi:MAG: D-alanine--D-alanine ligase [Bacteroidales bacterium]|nr:D-alanine--D-alanine ligase [Bacteroidales bacterium]